MRDRYRRAAEIKSVHQNPGDDAVADALPLPASLPREGGAPMPPGPTDKAAGPLELPGHRPERVSGRRESADPVGGHDGGKRFKTSAPSSSPTPPRPSTPCPAAFQSGWW